MFDLKRSLGAPACVVHLLYLELGSPFQQYLARKWITVAILPPSVVAFVKPGLVCGYTESRLYLLAQQVSRFFCKECVVKMKHSIWFSTLRACPWETKREDLSVRVHNLVALPRNQLQTCSVSCETRHDGMQSNVMTGDGCVTPGMISGQHNHKKNQKKNRVGSRSSSSRSVPISPPGISCLVLCGRSTKLLLI